MLGDKEVCAVLAVKDVDKALQFYTETLGLKEDKKDPGGVLLSSGKGKLYVYQSEFAGSNKATAVAWNVDNVEEVVNDLKGKGVSFEHYDNLPGTTLEGDIHVMGPARAVWFKDLDGNILNVVSGM
jgi:catechol 2,3-dioxygenase-like lactoylglutathione lyase family enzyme